jgi:hypothetical protein
MSVRLEHANVCVREMEAMIRFLQTAFPEFRVRDQGMGKGGRRWAHVDLPTRPVNRVLPLTFTVEPRRTPLPERSRKGCRGRETSEIRRRSGGSDRRLRTAVRNSKLPGVFPELVAGRQDELQSPIPNPELGCEGFS